MGDFTTGPTTGQKATSTDALFGDTSVYYQAFAQDPQVFAITAQGFFQGLRNSQSPVPGYNQLQYLQASIRKLGLSKGQTPIGQLDSSDYDTIHKIFKEGYQNKMDWEAVLNGYAQSPYLKLGTSGFSKQVATALKTIDKGDAATILNKAFFENFNMYPNSKQISDFMNKWNAEAKKQMGKTTTTTKGGAIEGVSSTSSVTEGMGFTQEEQDQFLATYLKKNYKITGKEAGGQVKTILTSLSRVYQDNLMTPPPIEEQIQFASTLIGMGDDTLRQQALDTKLQSVRLAASKLYPGMTDALTNGTDLKTIADPIRMNLNTTLGLNIMDNNDDRIKAMMNYNDGKVTRVMNAAEQKKYIESLPEFATSDAGRAKYYDIANTLEDRLR